MSSITISNDNTDSDSNGFYARVNGTLAFLKIGNGTTTATAFASTSLAIGSWSMLTWTYDGTTVTGYDGTSEGNANTISSPASGSNNVAFGYNPSSSGDDFDGQQAGIAIYNRVLSPR